MARPLLDLEATGDWKTAAAIRDRGQNMAILPRQAPAWAAEALDALADMALPKIEMEGSIALVSERLVTSIARLVPGELGSWLADDVRLLLDGWAMATQETWCVLRMEAVGNDACRKFHTDMVRVRLLCTYRGPGSEWVPNECVRRSHLGPGGENEDIVPDPAAIRRVPRFAAAFLKGDAYDPRTPGIVHRSPSHAAGMPARLLLRIDGNR